MNADAKARVLSILATWHMGERYGIGAEALAALANVSEREVRHAVTAIREDGIGVCAHPTTGYFIAETDAELERYCIQFLKDRALHSLRLAAKLTKTALPDLVGQLKLES